MKCVSGGHEDHNNIFQGQLEELKFITGDLDTTSVTIIGDWNADLAKVNHPHVMAPFSNNLLMKMVLLYLVISCCQMILSHLSVK